MKKATKKKVARKTAKKIAKKKATKKPAGKAAKKAAKKTAKKTSAKRAKKKAAGKKTAAKKTAKKTVKKKAPARKSSAKKAARPIDIYYWPTPNGWKITIFCEEAGVPYNIKPVNIGRGDQFKESFLKIAPNNRMPAIIDPDGPGGRPVSIFESGAILQYLGEKTGRFYPKDWRRRIEVDEWLFWQMANLGPNCGQTHHFRNYAQEKVEYAVDRFTNEVNRLYGVLDGQLEGRDYVCGQYSIADMAIWPWIVPWKNQGQDIEEFPNVKAWLERMRARPGVSRGFEVGKELRNQANLQSDEEARKILFGQRARKR